MEGDRGVIFDWRLQGNGDQDEQQGPGGGRRRVRSFTFEDLEFYVDIATEIHRLDLLKKVEEYQFELELAASLITRDMTPATNIPMELLREIRGKYDLPYFVETGTAMGFTAMLMSPLFEKVWTVELSRNTVSQTAQRLTRYTNVTIAQGSSPEFLRGLKLDRPALFWLDAHWCGGLRLGPECPVIEELNAIGGVKNGNVILIDDARLFLAPPPLPHRRFDWPTFATIFTEIRNWNADIKVVGDVIMISPREDE